MWGHHTYFPREIRMVSPYFMTGRLRGTYFLYYPGVVPLFDAATMELAGRDPGRPYARTRLFGSVGFVAAAQGVGLLLSARGDVAGDLTVPVAYALFALGWAGVAQTFPSVSAHPDR